MENVLKMHLPKFNSTGKRHKHILFKIFIAILASATIFTGTGATLASAGMNEANPHTSNGRAVGSVGLSDGAYIPTPKGAYVNGHWSKGVGKLPNRYRKNIVLVRDNAVTRIRPIRTAAEVGDRNFYFRDVVGHILLATDALGITHEQTLNEPKIISFIVQPKGKYGMPSKAQIKQFHLQSKVGLLKEQAKANKKQFKNDKVMMEQSKALYDTQHGIDEQH